MERPSDYGAFMEKFLLPPTSSPHTGLPLNSLTFAVKDIFDIEGYVTGFGNPDWARTHPVATSTAPTVLALLRAGATCVGKTVMDEMAYSINGENIHYGTPRNPCAADRVPGGSSSGSAVAVGAMLVDFSIGTDTGGSVRVPASYCGIFGFRPSHGAISTSGVIPMAQTFDTVGWFARDPTILSRVGRVLLQLPELAPLRPTCIIIAEDCFKLSSIPYDSVQGIVVKAVEKLYGGDVLKHEILGEYVKTNVASLKHFISKENTDQVYNIPSLAALSSAMRLLQRYEFKNNHGEWVSEVKPELGPGISERISDALRTTGENIDICHSIKQELHDALTALLGDFGVLMIPTVPGPPPKLQTNPSELEIFRARAFSLLSIVGVSGFCQVLHICRANQSITCQRRMDHQGHSQHPSTGAQLAYGSNPYQQPSQITGSTGMFVTSAGTIQPTGQPGGAQLGQHQLAYQHIHQQQQQQLQQQLQDFWGNQYQEIEKVTDFKNHSLPLARIKKIMKADEDVRMISAEAPVIFARACEMFILELTLRSWNHTEENKRRTLQKNDIAAAITRTDIFDFLVDIVPREDLKDEVLASIPRGTMAVAGPADGLPYCYMPPQHAPQVGNAGVMMGKPVMDPNMYAQQSHPYMAPQMWPQPPEQQQSSPDH